MNHLNKRAWIIIAAAAVIAVLMAIIIIFAPTGSTSAPVMLTVSPDGGGKKPETTVTTGEASVVTYGTNSYTVPQSLTESEMRAVWVPYMSLYGLTKEGIDKIVSDCRNIGANAIIFHVRPFGDAVYDSEFFPWSHLLTGTQGADPGYDPLEYVIEKAHENGMELHAWINPLRISLSGGTPSPLSADNPYTKWRTDSDPSNDSWVVDYNGGKYYNPAVPEVRRLIIDGMVEIAAKYNVDGIHWDDYFYPAEDSSFGDGAQYSAYTASGGTASLIEWRTENINTLIRESYSRIKATDSSCIFGISPAGNIQNCLNAGADVYKWCSSGGYIDYICPQIYWTFESKVAPFDARCREWKAMVTNDDIDFYVGLALYKAGSDADGGQWKRSTNIIARQIEYLRSDAVRADGFMLYSYEYISGSQTFSEMENLIALLAANE
ncbi:MAG: hypothetical protein E7546_04040 [Ruminococcaceae bacterium]|nr:hypothetical protein [Oscillospiraceae bacterium]